MYKKICWRWISLFCVALCWKMNVYTTILFFETKYMYSQTLQAFVLKQCELMKRGTTSHFAQIPRNNDFPVTDMNILTNYNLYNNKANTAFHSKQRMCIDFIYFDVAFSKRVKRMQFFQLFPTVVTSSTNYKLFI